MRKLEKKIILGHDWLTGFRGGERVLEAFCEEYPEAPLYSLIYSKGSTSAQIENRNIQTSFLNHIPGIENHYRKFLPLFPLAIEKMKVKEDADLFLSSSHCVIKGLKKPNGSVHVSYVHSPMRYLYDQYDVYFGKSAPLYQQLGAKVFRKYLTNWDIKSNENVDYFIANSEFVKDRIQKYYKKESVVIHPFVDLLDFEHLNEIKDDFYIMVTAFAPNKRVDLAIKAFNKLGKRLKIIGSGQQEEMLKKLAGPNIEFLGNVSRSEVVKNFAKARALIFPGVEDFGITPLESLASGTPVIAFRAGGVLETLNEDVAVFFNDATINGIEDAVLRFEALSFEKYKLIQRANKFSKDEFKKNINSFLSEVAK